MDSRSWNPGAVEREHETCRRHDVDHECLSDHVDASLYTKVAQEFIGDFTQAIWRVARSTSQLEGYHVELSKSHESSRMRAKLLNAVVHELASEWNRRASQQAGRDICPITDLRDWADFKSSTGNFPY